MYNIYILKQWVCPDDKGFLPPTVYSMISQRSSNPFTYRFSVAFLCGRYDSCFTRMSEFLMLKFCTEPACWEQTFLSTFSAHSFCLVITKCLRHDPIRNKSSERLGVASAALSLLKAHSRWRFKSKILDFVCSLEWEKKKKRNLILPASLAGMSGSETHQAVYQAVWSQHLFSLSQRRMHSFLMDVLPQDISTCPTS